MKPTTIAAFLAAVLTLAVVAGACAPCVCGEWGTWKNGACPDEHGQGGQCCQERSTGHGHWEHRHGEMICPPEPTPTPTPTPTPEPTPVPTPVAVVTFVPYQEFSSDCNPTQGPVVAIARGNYGYVAMTGEYASRFDTLEMCTYHGEYLATQGFWKQGPIDGVRSYGGMPVVALFNPQKAIGFRAAKDSLTDTVLPMTVTIASSDGTVLYQETTTERTVQGTIVLIR